MTSSISNHFLYFLQIMHNVLLFLILLLASLFLPSLFLLSFPPTCLHPIIFYLFLPFFPPCLSADYNRRDVSGFVKTDRISNVFCRVFGSLPAGLMGIHLVKRLYFLPFVTGTGESQSEF